MFKRNKRIICTISVGIIAFILFSGFLNWKMFDEVYAGDHYLGATLSSQNVLSEYEKLKELQQKEHPELSHVSSRELKLVKKKKWFAKDDTEQIIQDLPSLINPLVQGSEIQVDGKRVAVVANEGQAIRTVSMLKAPYETDADKNAELVEKVTFLPVMVEPESVVTAERAAELMSQVKEAAKFYEVEDGDTLWDIALKTNTPFDQLLLINTESGDLLKAGQKVILSPEKRFVNVRTQIKKAEQFSIPYRTIVQTETVQEQEGKEGLKEITYQITALNGIHVSSDKIEEKIIREPVNQIKGKRVRVQAASFRPSIAEGLTFIWPTDGGTITSGFGMREGEFHKGYDIAGAKSLQIKASAPGEVVFSGWKNGYGKIIILSHPGGFTTYYAHNREINVSVGNQVRQGQVIAVMGSTGDSTGVHLHFEIRSKGQAVDPGSYLK